MIDDSSESEAQTVRVPRYHTQRLSFSEQHNHNHINHVKRSICWCGCAQTDGEDEEGDDEGAGSGDEEDGGQSHYEDPEPSFAALNIYFLCIFTQHLAPILVELNIFSVS